jgi:hypothetical protein
MRHSSECSPQRRGSCEKIQKSQKLQILRERNQVLATDDFREKGFFLMTAECAELGVFLTRTLLGVLRASAVKISNFALRISDFGN